MKILRESKVAKRIFLTVFAMVVIVLSFTLAGDKAMAAEDDVVYIPDANFKALLNEKLGVDDPTADITEGQMASIKSLTISIDDEVKNITGISYCTGIESLNIDGNYNNWIDFDSYFAYNLSQLKSVKYFDADYINVEDYSFVEKWTNLMSFSVDDSNIVELPDLKKCTNISHIELCYCKSLTDISSLSNLSNLEYVDFTGCDSIKRKN